MMTRIAAGFVALFGLLLVGCGSGGGAGSQHYTGALRGSNALTGQPTPGTVDVTIKGNHVTLVATDIVFGITRQFETDLDSSGQTVITADGGAIRFTIGGGNGVMNADVGGTWSNNNTNASGVWVAWSDPGHFSRPAPVSAGPDTGISIVRITTSDFLKPLNVDVNTATFVPVTVSILKTALANATIPQVNDDRARYSSVFVWYGDGTLARPDRIFVVNSSSDQTA